jgi:hypothetical protein
LYLRALYRLLVAGHIGHGDIGQGMHIGQNGSRESGQVPAALVFIPNDILRDERRGYDMKQERNEVKYVKI